MNRWNHLQVFEVWIGKFIVEPDSYIQEVFFGYFFISRYFKKKGCVKVAIAFGCGGLIRKSCFLVDPLE